MEMPRAVSCWSRTYQNYQSYVVPRADELLEQVGLAAPQVTYIMHELRNAGLNVDPEATTLEEAKAEILRVLGKR